MLTKSRATSAVFQTPTLTPRPSMTPVIMAHNGGAPPSRFYVYLREAVARVLTAEHCVGQSFRIRAEMLGIPKTTYVRLEAFVERYSSLIAQARASGDWTAIEDILFGPFGQYRYLPSYRKALAQIAANVAACPPIEPKEAKPPEKAPLRTATEPEKKSAATTLQQVERWIRLGMAAEAFITPQGLELLLKEHSQRR